MKHHLFAAKIPKKLFKKIKELGDNDKKDEFKKERMFGRVAKIPIADTFVELVEMDFVDYGDVKPFCTFEILFRASPPLFFRG